MTKATSFETLASNQFTSRPIIKTSYPGSISKELTLPLGAKGLLMFQLLQYSI